MLNSRMRSVDWHVAPNVPKDTHQSYVGRFCSCDCTSCALGRYGVNPSVPAYQAVRLTAAQDVWPEVLRCISRFELLSQMSAGGITDMALFAPPAPEPESPSGFMRLRRGLFHSSSAKPARPEGVLSMPVKFVPIRICKDFHRSRILIELT